MIQTTTENFQTATELRSCGACDFQGEMEIGTRLCPQCDESSLMEAESVGWLGALTAFLGSILMFMGFALILITSEHFGYARKTSSKVHMPVKQLPPYAETIVYLILGGLFCLGLSYFIVGVVQACQQRRNINLLYLSLRLTNFFLVFVYILMCLFSE